ncbi:MAG: hypothetical protein ABSD20_08555 [Terriglobales bacterium]|jgi:hypothetical protein
MSIQDVSAEHLAELFHHYHEALGTDIGCRDNPNMEGWEHILPQERKRIVAATRLALLELAFRPSEAEDLRRYYAQPGEAEWGC